MTQPNCQAITQEGRACGSYAQQGKLYCYSHRKYKPKNEGEKKKKEAKSDTDDTEYVIEKLVGRRENDDGSVSYKVRWSGYSSKDDTWEPRTGLPIKLVSAYDEELAESKSSKKRKIIMYTPPAKKKKVTDDSEEEEL